MILSRLLKNLFARKTLNSPQFSILDAHHTHIQKTKKVLNVGGGSKEIPIPPHYTSWQHILLDVSPAPDVDIVHDATKLLQLPSEYFDAIYCSHNLEHYFIHEARIVLSSFKKILSPEGFAEIRVPDLIAAFKYALAQGIDVDDVLYVSGVGPITLHDLVYGYGKQIESSGMPWYAHKCGFTPNVLRKELVEAGFAHVHIVVDEGAFEVRALAFKGEPSTETKEMLRLV